MAQRKASVSAVKDGSIDVWPEFLHREGGTIKNDAGKPTLTRLHRQTSSAMSTEDRMYKMLNSAGLQTTLRVAESLATPCGKPG